MLLLLDMAKLASSCTGGWRKASSNERRPSSVEVSQKQRKR